ncbi:MAG TPA: 3-hydroxyacyl-CoA dehydrogenase NAD-binding domain-containing protein [Saprospiraceae bacterium]|nr:3-hydroxyacyl-CoA dehydrogenase NAD-binding domain-containing protein [Saprospiraceae bacterium]
MNRIAVIGAGAMGSGIGQVAAMAGHEVIIYDAHPDATIKSRDTILSSLNRLVVKNKFSDQASKEIFGRIYFADKMESITGSGLVVEAIIEDVDEKRKIFQQIESIVADDAIIATNTSSLSVTGLAKVLNKPDRFIGIHFFNPPVLMKLVEIIPALQTSEQVIQSAIELITSWDKTVVKAKDTPGFIVNRIARPFYGEALRIAEEQIAEPFYIDLCMREVGFKMGPFELMDFIGNDINESVTRTVWAAMYFDSRYKPSVMQANLVRAGWLGRKSGRGFYQYGSDVPVKSSESGMDKSVISDRIIAMLINEAAEALHYGISSKEDIDLAMTLGVNYPSGLLKWADQIGIDNCVSRMDALFNAYHEERYRCSILLRKMASSQRTFYT